MTPCRRTHTRAGQRGLSLVELMVGITVGLFVVAGASMVVATQLGDNRRLLLETQLQQDLRATADIIVRELRRAGGSESAQALVARPAVTPTTNPKIQQVELKGGGTEVQFHFERAVGDIGPFGFRWDSKNGVVTSLLGGRWQELTDATTMKVTDFKVTESRSGPFRVPCTSDCPGGPGDTSCWPALTVRAYDIAITAQARGDETVVRQIRSTVRLRNDRIASQPDEDATELCP